MRRFVASLSVVMPMLITIWPDATFAQSALSNGANHPGVIQVGGLDTWTFAATKNDGITLSLAKVLGSGSDPDFRPWLRLKSPDGSLLDDQFTTQGGENSVQIDRRAPLTGTYTVLVANASSFQTSPASYALTLAKTPGPYTISAGDEGGPLTNGSHTGSLFVGDLDPWTVQAAINDSLTISLAKILGSGSADFRPWLRLKGPDGTLLDNQFTTQSGENSVQITRRVSLAGTYTILVANASPFQTSSTSYTLTLSGPSSGFSVASILPVAGSLQGNGAFFRTRVQIYNPRTSAISGKFVFHVASATGSPNDPSLSYTLNGGQTIDYLDILPAIGISSGLGSIDIMINPGDPVPIMSARVFSDAGVNGTAGFFIDPVGPDAALQSGDSGVLIAPADSVAARLNLGIRSLETGASFTIAVRSKSGVVRNTVTKTYGPTFFEQVSANSYLGVTLDSSDTIIFAMTSGKAIIYGAQTDNKTQDPSVQYAKKVF